MHPSALPDLFKGTSLSSSDEYSGSGDSAIMLEGTINGERRIFTYEASFPARATDHPFLRKSGQHAASVFSSIRSACMAKRKN